MTAAARGDSTSPTGADLVAVILAAGRGTRLGELGRRVPKVLVDVGGEPLLARQLRYLAANGVTSAYVNAHHLHEQIEEFALRHTGPPRLDCVVEDRILGTAGGTCSAVAGVKARFVVVLYGDVLFDERLAPMVDQHLRTGAAATLACYHADTTQGKGVVDVGRGGRVRSFVEKRGDGPGFVNAGLYLADAALLQQLPKATELDFGHDVFPRWLAEDRHLHMYRMEGVARDIGTLEALASARAQAPEEPGRAA